MTLLYTFQLSFGRRALFDAYDIYALGISAGALGGKLLGAGGGGFILFLARPECHMMIRNALKDLLYVPFKFETEGAIRIIS